jgi:hypothetical protein
MSETDPKRSPGFLLAHWKGEYSLPRAFWLHTVALWGLLVLAFATQAMTVGKQRRLKALGERRRHREYVAPGGHGGEPCVHSTDTRR